MRHTQLKPISTGINPTISKTEATYQHHLLQMISQMVKQQKISNQLLAGMTGNQQIKQEQQKSQTIFKKSSPQRFSSQQKYRRTVVSPIKNQQTGKQAQKILYSQVSQKQFEKIQQRKNTKDNRQNLSGKIYDILERFEERLKRTQEVQTLMLQELRIMNGNHKPESHNRISSRDYHKPNQPTILLIPGQKNQAITEEGTFERQKYYSRLSQIQPHSDRRQTKVRIDFLQIVKDTVKNMKFGATISIETLFKFVSEWVGIVYRATASISWNMLQNQLLNFNETKVLFTENIIFNYIEVIKDLRKIYQEKKIQGAQNYLDIQYRVTERINKQSIQVLKYLCRQYPQTKIQAPNLAIKSSLPKINQKGKIEYQLVGTSKIKFTKKENTNYAAQIMQFINYLIDTTQENFDFFEKKVQSYFDKIFIPQANRQFQCPYSPIEYKQKVKKYTKVLIGRKIPKNTQKYSQQEIQNGIFFIKSPKILRVLVKWVEQLTQTISNPKNNILEWYYPFKTHQGEQYHAQYLIRKGIYQKILNTRGNLFKKMKQIEMFCYKIQGVLTSEEHIAAEQLIHLSQQQINVGIFSSNMKNALSSYLYLQLNQLINFLINVPLSVDPQQLGFEGHHFIKGARQNLNKINLVTFRVFDLLRCKCISGDEQIIYLLNKFKANKQDVSIVRCKDRLSTGTRDLLLNVKFQQGPVCQIQMAISSQSDIKQDLLDKYNHFLYELQRSKTLGPLIQNISIWTSLQQRALYFDQLTKRKFYQAQNKPFQHARYQCKSRSNHSVKPFVGPIVCMTCNVFYDIPKTCLYIWKCTVCQETVCGQCFYKGKNEIQKKRTILGPLADPNLLPYITQFTERENLQKMPKYCFATKLPFLTPQLSFVEHCPPKKADDNRQIAQIVIRKQIKKVIIRGFLSELHASDKDKIENFILYGIDPKIISVITLKQLKQRVQKQSDLKIVNIMNEPNETAKIAEIVETYKKLELMAYLEEIFQITEVQKVAIVSIPNTKTIILAQIYFQQQRLSKKLTKRANLHEIKAMAKTNASVICLQHKKLSNQFQENKISKYIDQSDFQQLCNNVKKLQLSYGQVQLFSYFRKMVNVTILSIDKNRLVSFEGIQNMKMLKKVSAISNNIKTLQHLYPLSSIQILTVDFNKIESLKGIDNLVQLFQFSISQNLISEFGNHMVKLAKLKKVYMRNNRLQDFDKVPGLENITKISLSKNPLKVLRPLTFLPKLINLSISDLKFDKVPFESFSMLDLKVLSLHENNIRVIQGLQTQKNLNYIGLNTNKIQKMQGLSKLHHLQIISLQNNQIKRIQGIKEITNSLKLLQLRKNPLQDVGELNDIVVSFEIKWSSQDCTESVRQQMQKILKIPMQILSTKLI